MSPLLKTCGVSDAGFAAYAASHGADVLGVIFAERSPRRVDIGTAARIAAAARAASPGVRIAGVFDRQPAAEAIAAAKAVPLDIIQFHGGYSDADVAAAKAAGFETWRLANAATSNPEACDVADATLLDGVSGGMAGGTGKLADWSIAGALAARGRRVVLAGGISEDNIAAAAAVGPAVIDVNSSIETAPGVKSREKFDALVARLRPAKSLPARLRARLGDFWWYSLMVFAACRVADLANVFVGLWLVPKCIDPSELGAVMPLAGFANFLVIPAAAFATAFRNEVSMLAAKRDFGRLKTLVRGVFFACAAALVLAMAAARLVLPRFLRMIRIEEGSLGFFIILAAFLSAVAPIYTNVLQALGKFREMSLLYIAGAPLRLATMAAAMPFRAVTGYFAGQCASPALSAAASVFFLRRELSVRAEPYWNRRAVRRFAAVFAMFAVAGFAASAGPLAETSIIRERLCDLDSAGYYVATRFSDVAMFMSMALCCTIFPFSAKLAAGGEDPRPLVLKAAAATSAFCMMVAAPFLLWGREIISIVPGGEAYAACWWAVPCLAAVAAANSFVAVWTASETAAGRFGYLKWLVPADVAYTALLASAAPWTATLARMVCLMACGAAAKAALCAVHMALFNRVPRSGRRPRR